MAAVQIRDPQTQLALHLVSIVLKPEEHERVHIRQGSRFQVAVSHRSLLIFIPEIGSIPDLRQRNASHLPRRI